MKTVSYGTCCGDTGAGVFEVCLGFVVGTLNFVL